LAVVDMAVGAVRTHIHLFVVEILLGVEELGIELVVGTVVLRVLKNLGVGFIPFALVHLFRLNRRVLGGGSCRVGIPGGLELLLAVLGGGSVHGSIHTVNSILDRIIDRSGGQCLGSVAGPGGTLVGQAGQLGVDGVHLHLDGVLDGALLALLEGDGVQQQPGVAQSAGGIVICTGFQRLHPVGVAVIGHHPVAAV